MNGISISPDTVGIKQLIQAFNKGLKTFLYLLNPLTSDTNSYFTPDETALLADNKSYFDIVPKDEWIVKMIARWKLLESLSYEKGGNLYLYVPGEETEEFRDLIEHHQIKAIICPTPTAV